MSKCVKCDEDACYESDEGKDYCEQHWEPTRNECVDEYTASYINGNREFVCREILTGPNPAVMAAMVVLELSRKVGFADDFIRILEAQTE